LFSYEQSEDDLKEIKSLLITCLSDKVTREADKAFEANAFIALLKELPKLDTISADEFTN
jgi:hypothetical protein